MGVQLLKFNLLWMNKYYPVKLDRLILFIYQYILIIIWIFFKIKKILISENINLCYSIYNNNIL